MLSIKAWETGGGVPADAFTSAIHSLTHACTQSLDRMKMGETCTTATCSNVWKLNECI